MWARALAFGGRAQRPLRMYTAPITGSSFRDHDNATPKRNPAAQIAGAQRASDWRVDVRGGGGGCLFEKDAVGNGLELRDARFALNVCLELLMQLRRL